MNRVLVPAVALAAALLSACAGTPRQPAAPQAEGPVLLSHATGASLGLAFPAGQATRAQVMGSLGEPHAVGLTTAGGTIARFTYTASTGNCNHRRLLTHTAEFQFDSNDVVSTISLRHGARWR
jgi:hypothetical protein